MITAIILNRNRSHLLHRLLSNLAALRLSAYLEVIVVDHGSEDVSVAVAGNFATKLPLRLVALPNNYSFAYSCNRAAEIARGEVLVFLNNDVAMVNDVLTPLAEAARRSGGLVGLRLLKQGWRGPRVQHVGVQFHWNLRRGMVLPHEVTRPADGDGKQAFPAVTAAVVACRRDVFLRIGGFHEGYCYGYEDIDLCLKAGLGHRLPVEILAGVHALHDHGGTRLRLRRDRRKRWLEHNVAVFKTRFGYRLRREAWSRLLEGDRAWWGRPPRVRLMGRGGDGRNLADRLAAEHGWEVVSGPFRHADLALVLAPPRWPDRLGNMHPATVRTAWASQATLAAWCRCDLQNFDLLCATDAAVAEALHEAAGRPVHLLPANAPPEDLIALLLDFVCEKHRFAVKGLGGDPRADALAAALRAAGHQVRVDLPPRWTGRDTLRDDVCVWLARPGPTDLPPDKINILLDAEQQRPPPGFDAVIAGGADEDLLPRLLEMVAALHHRRMAPASDPPLTDRSAAVASPDEAWLDRQDPVHTLLQGV